MGVVVLITQGSQVQILPMLSGQRPDPNKDPTSCSSGRNVTQCLARLIHAGLAGVARLTQKSAPELGQ